MKKLPFLLLLITSLIMTSSLHAVWYLFPANEPAYLKEEAVMEVGTKLYLFHSCTEEVRKTIRVNDVLTVFREYPADFPLETTEAGKVRILSALGDYYFEGEVIGGDVRPGFVAKKGTVACFITSFKKRLNLPCRK
jgi:hypothetical protein